MEIKNKTKNKTIISLELPEELKQRLQTEAKEKEMSTSAFIRYIIKQYYNSKSGS